MRIPDLDPKYCILYFYRPNIFKEKTTFPVKFADFHFIFREIGRYLPTGTHLTSRTTTRKTAKFREIHFGARQN